MNPKYTKKPKVPADVAARLEAMARVMSGELTATEAAERLGLSREHFTSLMNRGLEGMIEGLSARPTGRPPSKSDRERELEAELERLRAENRQLSDRVGMIDRLLTVAGGVLNGRVKAGRQSRKPKGGANEPEEPDGARKLLEAVADMKTLGLPPELARALAGIAASTERRWRQRLGRGEPPRRRRGRPPARPPPPEVRQRVGSYVRETRGVAGVEVLRRLGPGITRRDASTIKRETMTELERERRLRFERIFWTRPGVVRGFDVVHVPTLDGLRYLLVFSDAAVPYRTRLELADRYTGEVVADALARDFAENGAPLVWRVDRAKAHETSDVLEVLSAHDVLLLHGPAHRPQYYGQLERQNREHRSYLRTLLPATGAELARELESMRRALNGLPRRATLRGRTAEQLWNSRPALDVDRSSFRDEVMARAEYHRPFVLSSGAPADHAERLAIEEALAHRGLLRRLPRGWC